MPDEPQHYDPNATQEERGRWMAEWFPDYDNRPSEPRWLVTVRLVNAQGDVLSANVTQEGCTQAEAVKRTLARYEWTDLMGQPMTVTHVQAINMKHVRL